MGAQGKEGAVMQPTAWQRWWALLRQRCPRCCQGRIYEHGMQMHAHCPVCNLRFEREPGYFLGALYISYGMATLCMLFGLWIGNMLMPNLDLGWVVLIAAACFIPFVPTVTRYARVIWIFFDRWAWPTHADEKEDPQAPG
jgi:uncharacterized protein (DUF983 family)